MPDRMSVEEIEHFVAGGHLQLGGRDFDEKALQIIRQLLEERSWQPIETAPQDGTPVLLFRRIDPWHVIGTGEWAECAGISGWLARGISDPPGNLGLAAPTHWMPLPTPPKDTARKGEEL